MNRQARRLLGMVFLCALAVTKCQEGCVCDSGGANSCMCTGEVIRIGDGVANRLVNISSEIPCFTCIQNGMEQTVVRWSGRDISGDMFLLRSSDDGRSLGLDVTDQGRLTMCDPARYIPPGSSGFSLSCQVSTISTETVYANEILPPNLSVTSVTIPEGNPQQVVSCVQNTPPGLNPDSINWFDEEENLVPTEFVELTFVNISRGDAGTYRCTLTVGSVSRSSSVTIVVLYGPEGTTEEAPMQEVQLDGTLSLTCSFDGIPTPSVVWLLNDTIELTDSDSRVSISNTPEGGNNPAARRTVLEVSDIGRDDGGVYTCRFNISDEVFSINATTVLILIPPGPITELQETIIETRRIIITWTKGFDGFSPFTGASIVYTPDGGNPITDTVTSADPTNYTLENLMPFTNYSISVALSNRVGTGDSVSIIVMTASLQLPPPINVDIIITSSTSFQVTWDPPAPMAGVDVSSGWFVEIERVSDGMGGDNMTINDPSVTVATFSDDIRKGTEYRARVRGSNSAGNGTFSDYVIEETDVDPPSEPLNVMVTGVTSFVLDVSWSPPTDNGGRMVTSYVVSVAGEEEEVTVQAPTTTARIFGMDYLEEDTTFTVEVRARNERMLLGPAGTGQGTTLPIEQPQAIVREPNTVNTSNVSVTLRWEDPGGEVDAFIIQLTNPDESFNVTVNGTFTFHTLTNLNPDTSYDVVIFTVNEFGSSIASPLHFIATDIPPNPVIVSSPPLDNITVGDTVLLTCTSPDLSRPIEWTEKINNITLDPPTFVWNPDAMGISNLTINNIRTEHNGEYECRVKNSKNTVTITVIIPSESPPTTPPVTTPESTDEGISGMVIIIAACVGGGGALLLIVLLSLLIICCCCCSNKKGGKEKKYVTNKSLKPDKRTKELFEVSTNAAYGPVTTDGAGDETGISFRMPEEFQAHSSFNTMDKTDNPKVAKRSSSPEAAAATLTSFGARHSQSPPRYQDMPPASDNGTLL